MIGTTKNLNFGNINLTVRVLHKTRGRNSYIVRVLSSNYPGHKIGTSIEVSGTYFR